MRIGILTFHSQINYGGVLQCLALQKALEDLGHDVKVIDLWMHPYCEGLDGVFSKELPLQRRIKLIIQSLLWPRMAARQVRHWRTRRFINRYMHLSPYHFVEWKDSPKELGVDLIVVGSDQVWHCGDFGDPRPYLLEGAPEVKAIAYAASFGIREYPNGMIEVFREGFKRFSAISVRESAAVKLVEEAGREAVHVVDPTLLVAPQFWRELSPDGNGKVEDGILRVVCYFIRQDLEDVLPQMERFARQQRCRFDVITTQLKPHIQTVRQMSNYIKGFLGAYPHVHLRTATGPEEFLSLFSHADACITDSFHALMFSSVYGLNCRVMSPRNAYLSGQFSRLEEFAKYAEGPLVVPDFCAALDSFSRGECVRFKDGEIAARRFDCVQWLEKAIIEVRNA